MRARGAAVAWGLVIATVMAWPGTASQLQAQNGSTGREGARSQGATAVVDIDARRIAAAPSMEPDNWMTYYGGYDGQRFSQLDQIDRTNVDRLAPAWERSWPIKAKLESTPIVVDGVMYLTTGKETRLLALDAATGRERWRYEPPVGIDHAICCGQVNRGAAVADGKVFFTTLDAELHAVDARSGRPVWQTSIADIRDGYSATAAPLIVKDKVIVGIAGAEYGIRGFLAAYDLETGDLAWRFWTIPAPGEPGHETWGGELPTWRTGGGSTWITGTYDPELDLVYWGTGNAAPDLNGDVRPGDNLYTASVLALDPDDGSLRWHFQYTPHDVWDYDAVNVPILADVEVAGTPRKVILHANKNGYFYALDRATGEFLYARPFARQTWTTGVDSITGRPEVNPEGTPSAYYKPVCPSPDGATEWPHMAYSPLTRLAYVPVMEECALFRMGQAFYRRSLPYLGSEWILGAFGPDEAHGHLMAIDAATGRQAWSKDSADPVDFSVLATAGGLVFWRERDGTLHAADARSGDDLWSHDMGMPADRGAMMTYAVDGRQYLLVTSGNSELDHTVTVFALPR